MSFLEKKYNTSNYFSINYSSYENPELRIRKMERERSIPKIYEHITPPGIYNNSIYGNSSYKENS